MSLRAKCLPQKSSLPSKSATKPPTFNTSVKRSALNRREKRILLKKSTKTNQLTKNNLAKKPTLATTPPHRNVRTILKRKAVTRLSSTKAASSAKISKKSTEKIPINKTSGATKSKNPASKIKTCMKLEISSSSSSIICSRSGRKLVPARCACANDSVTARCSIHNNVQRQSTASSSTSVVKPKSSHNPAQNTTKKKPQDLLSAKTKLKSKQHNTMSSIAIPIQGSSTTTSSLVSSSVCNNLTSQPALHNTNTKSNEELLHEELSFSSSTSKNALLQPKNKNEVDGKSKVTTTPGLPSPTDSISETSDYQRSTPSPKDEIDSNIGNTMLEWSTNTTSQDKHSVPDPDQGFGEEDNKNDLENTNGTNKVPLVLQQLCAALQKMPDTKRAGMTTTKTNSTINSLQPTNTVNNNSSVSSQVSPNHNTSLPSTKPESHKVTESTIEETPSTNEHTQNSKTILGKRRKSMQSNLNNDSSSNCANLKHLSTSTVNKMRKILANDESENHPSCTKTGNIVSKSQALITHQGKITQYLPEMKDSTKKEKLEKIASANTYSLNAMDSSSKDHITNTTKTELKAPVDTNVDIDDAEEGVLVIDDSENTPSPQERVDDESDNRSSFTSEITKTSLLDDIKCNITETDLKISTNNIESTNDETSLKTNNEYSAENTTGPTPCNISSVTVSVPEQVPLNAYIKEEDVKLMPMSPLPCSSSSSGISSTSSSGSLKDDSSSEISLSRMSSASSSGASSYTKDYDHLFEMPRTIRFPAPSSSSGGIMGLNRNGGMSVTRISRSDSTENGTNNNNLTETVICKWELCGQEFDSNGKLLDHLKTVHARCDYGNKTNNNNSAYEENEGEKDTSNASTSSVQYKCLWEGCKVYGKGSSSKSWLEKHVIANHGGSKPFQCIVDGCKERFGTQSLLERHVNSHFKCKTSSNSSNLDSNSNVSSSMHSTSSPIASSHTNQANKLSKNSLSTNVNGHNRLYNSKLSRANKKLMAPNGKRLKYRKTIYSARIFDLFDLGVMAQVRQRIAAFETGCQKLRTENQITPIEEVSTKKVHHKEKSKRKEDKSKRAPASSTQATKTNYGVLDQTIEFRSEILAKRTDEDGQVRVLLQWIPHGIFENEWSLLQNALNTKKVKMSSLTSQQRLVLANEILQLGEPEGKRKPEAVALRCSERRGRKTKAPQSRSSALS